MFMRAQTFERRMKILQRRRIPVIPLAEAVERLERREIGNAETVITLDDGWRSNLTLGLPILEKYGYSACIYVATEHLTAGCEAFNVALNYMIRTSESETLNLSGVHESVDGSYDLRANPQEALEKLIRATERILSLRERQLLLRPIAAALQVDYDDVFRDGRFTLLNANEIRDLAARGVEIELHTHTHRLSDDRFDAVSWELEQNSLSLKSITGKEPRHFCYPSGIVRPNHPGWLRRLKIKSATTCEPGLNDHRVSPMVLRRYLDSEETPDIVFEAEICGVRELVRGLRTQALRYLPGLRSNDLHSDKSRG